jgi:hypothetical protein
MNTNKNLENAQKALGNIPHAVTGSKAMQLYGKFYNVQTRNSMNVNIAVNRKNMKNAYNALSGVPNSRLNYTNNHYKIGNKYDLIRAGSNLAPKISPYYILYGVPVVPLKELLKFKQKTHDNLSSVKYPNTKNMRKTLENIKTLRIILTKVNDDKKHLTPRSLKSPSPVRSRTSRFSGGSPPKVRKLTFND